VLAPGIELDDVEPVVGEERLVLEGLTWTHLSELMGSLWPADDERSQDNYWFAKFSRMTPYETFADVPEELRDRAGAARTAVTAHPWIDELIED
jgi:hypothetical protein